MNDWRAVLIRAQRPLMLLAGSIATGLALFFASNHVLNQFKQTLAQQQLQSSMQQARVAEKEIELTTLQANIGPFRAMEQLGMIGAADRAGWVEQLLASHKQLGLPETLSYTLKPPHAPGNGAAWLMHDLEFTIRDIHEDELIALLKAYRTMAPGRFRLQSCQLAEPGANGLAAACTLRFFTLPRSAGSPAR